MRLGIQRTFSLPLLGLTFGLVVAGPGVGLAQLQILADKEPQRVFAGDAQKVTVMFHNPGEQPVEADLHTRLYQASSAKAVLLGDTPWKRLQVLPGQTVLEAARLRFPPVKTETRFLLQWTDGPTRLLGMSEVFVNPPDLLKDLKTLAGKEAVGLYDPMDQLKPLLRTVEVEAEDLEKGALDGFGGKLAIIGPFVSKARMRGDLPGKIKALSERGVAVVWIVPPPEKRVELQPSFFTVAEGKAAVVVVQPALLANLSESPQAQQNLLKCVRLALHPEPPRLPYLSPPAQ